VIAVTVILGLILSLAAIAWVVWPLLNRAPAPVLVEDDRLTDLLSRKDAVVTAIRDLEFDYRVGKLDEADYQLYDARLRRQAVALIQQIEQLAPASTGLDATVEQEVLQRRRVVDGRQVGAAASPAVVAVAPAAVVAGVNGSVKPTANGVAPAKFCTNCGAAIESQYRFCASCGSPVQALTPAVVAEK